MMVKVLVYGCATGVFSSRNVARKLHEDLAFRVLAARNFPAHRTIRDFRAFHLKELSACVRALGFPRNAIKSGLTRQSGPSDQPRQQAQAQLGATTHTPSLRPTAKAASCFLGRRER